MCFTRGALSGDDVRGPEGGFALALERWRTARVAAAAVAISTIAFVVLPAQMGDVPSITEGLLFRGVLAGIVAGLLLGRGRPALLTLAAAVAASVLGVLAMTTLGVRALGAFPALCVLLAALAALVAAEVVARGGTRVVAVAGVALIAVAFLWQAGVVPSVNTARTNGLRYTLTREPAPEGYQDDAFLYLRTYYLTRDGVPYYQAFRTAFTQDRRFSSPPPFRLNYREPLLFEVWRVLPGQPGANIWYAYVFLGVGAIVVGYLLAREFAGPGPALLAPAALAGYFAWVVTEPYLTFSEFWAAPLAILAVWLMLRKRWWGAALAIVAAVAVRELMVYLLPAFALAWLLQPARRRPMAPAIVAIAVPPIILAVHLAMAPATGAASLSAAMWQHSGLPQLLAALQWSWNAMPFGKVVLPAATVAAIIGAAIARPRWKRFALLAVTVLPLVLFAMFTSGRGGEYWGAISQPLALALAPAAVARLLPAGPARGGGAGGSERSAA